MALADIIKESTPKSIPTVKLKDIDLSGPENKTTLFIPASDKVFARDDSRDFDVIRRTEPDSWKEVRFTLILAVRRLLDKHPEYDYKGFHSANVFERKHCYLFFDKKRTITVAMTEEEIERKLRR